MARTPHRTPDDDYGRPPPTDSGHLGEVLGEPFAAAPPPNLLIGSTFTPAHGTGTGNITSFTFTEDNSSNQHGVDISFSNTVALLAGVYTLQATIKMNGPAIRAMQMGVWSNPTTSGVASPAVEIDDPLSTFGPPTIVSDAVMQFQSWSLVKHADGTATVSLVFQMTTNNWQGGVYFYSFSNMGSTPPYQGDGVTNFTLTNVSLTNAGVTVPFFPDFVPIIPTSAFPPGGGVGSIGEAVTTPTFPPPTPPPIGTVPVGPLVGPAIAAAAVPPSNAGNALIRFTFGSATAPAPALAFPEFTTGAPSPPIVFSNIYTGGATPTTPPHTTTPTYIPAGTAMGPPIGAALPNPIPPRTFMAQAEVPRRGRQPEPEIEPEPEPEPDPEPPRRTTRRHHR